MKSAILLPLARWALTASLLVSAAPWRYPEGRWTTLPATGSGARQEHGTAALGDEIFVVGGIPPGAGNSGSPTPSVGTAEAYSIANKRWRALAPLPVPMTHVNLAAVDGRIVALGGLGGNGSEPVWRAVADCFAYDAAADRWEGLPPMPAGQARGAAAVGVLDGVVYLAGGLTELNLVPGGLQASVDLVTAYDARRHAWTTLPRLPGRRDHVGGAVVGRTWFVVGGRDHGQENGRNSTFAMDLERVEDGWATRSPMPTARGGLSVGVIGDYVAAFGGEGNPDPGSNGVFNNTEMYDVKRDRWTVLGPMPVPRHGTIAASVGGRIYIPGGGTQQGAGPTDSFVSFELV